MTTWRTRARPAMLALCLVLAACGKSELYSKLSEGQANEMLAVLQASGLSASKEEHAETGWTVSTDSDDFAKAVEVLHAQGYPRDDFATLGTVFKKEGFVSSPTEERARLVYGMSQELSHTISEIDGVVQARVHLALPEDKPLAETTQPSSASVFIKYRPGTNIESQVVPEHLGRDVPGTAAADGGRGNGRGGDVRQPRHDRHSHPAADRAWHRLSQLAPLAAAADGDRQARPLEHRRWCRPIGIS
jgi:type III secretion system YscJ/HrcJ family lipoprotein